MYQIRTTDHGRDVVIKDGVLWIPADPANVDYAEFLEWCAAGNEPGVWDPEVK